MIQNSDAVSEANRTVERHFNAMVQSAQPDLLPVKVDETDHVANGLLHTGNGRSHKAIFAYEKNGNTIRLTIIFPCLGKLSETQRGVMDQLQAASKLSRFDPDMDQRRLFLTVCSVCSTPEDPRDVVRRLVKDIQRILADDRLSVVLGQ